MSDLRDDLEAIDGVGQATADKILDVLDAHDTGETDPLLERATAAAERGDDRDAAVFLRRMKELRQLVDEAPTHDDDLPNDMARPDSWIVHINERSTFSKAPENWRSLS